MSSNVGNSQVYEDGDQKNVSRAEIDQEKQDKRFHEGRENSHKANDSSEHLRYIILQDHTDSTAAEDQRSIANKLAREQKVQTNT